MGRGRTGAAAILAAVCATGCLALPEQDSAWGRMADDGLGKRINYARDHEESAGAWRKVHYGVAVGGLAVNLVGLWGFLDCPQGSDCEARAGVTAIVGAVVAIIFGRVASNAGRVERAWAEQVDALETERASPKLRALTGRPRVPAKPPAPPPAPAR